MKTRKKNFFNREDVIAFNIDDDYTHFLVFQLISLAKNSSELIINWKFFRSLVIVPNK